MRSRRSAAGLGLLAITMLCLFSTASASALTFPYFNPFNHTPSTLTGGEVTLESATFLAPVKCTSLGGQYTATSVHEGTATIALKGCSAPPFEGTCATSGAAAGEITVTPKLPMLLAYLSKATHEAAMVLNYHKSGEISTFAKFTCEGGNYTARGSLVAKLTPIHTWTTKYQLILKSAAIKQEFTKYQIEVGGGAVEEFTTQFFIGFGSEPTAAGALNAGTVNFVSGFEVGLEA
jgi:hypothetical protein